MRVFDSSPSAGLAIKTQIKIPSNEMVRLTSAFLPAAQCQVNLRLRAGDQSGSSRSARPSVKLNALLGRFHDSLGNLAVYCFA